MKPFAKWFLRINVAAVLLFLGWLYVVMWIRAWLFMAVLHYLILMLFCATYDYD